MKFNPDFLKRKIWVVAKSNDDEMIESKNVSKS